MYVVLVDPQNPGNVGFIARVMANFGVTNLRIVGEDIRYDPQAQIFSVHAADVLEGAGVYDNLEGALEDIDAVWVSTARTGSNHSVTRVLVPLQELPDPNSLNGKVALVFGRESTGLTNEEIAMCDLTFTIPAMKSYRSLNLSHAVAVVLYQLYTDYAPKESRIPTEQRAATFDEREQVCIFFDELVELTTIKDFRKPIAKQVFRNLLGRAYMTGREIATLTGTVRKIKQLVDSEERTD